MSDVASLWLLFGLPPAAPIVAALIAFAARDTGRWRWPLALSYVALVFCGAIATTNMAYHVREGYKNLPDVNWAVWAGLVWAGALTLPSAIALALRYKSMATALLTGLGVGVLSAITLISTSFGLMMMLSFE
ncbi:MAG TPA: hypothetical protein VIS55_16940 [Pseudomonadales bacterium]|jgi:hypothetical protein